MILYASGQGTSDWRSSTGPLLYALMNHIPASKVILPADQHFDLAAASSIRDNKNELCTYVSQNPKERILSADHSSAMGYWQGMMQTYPDIKILWIDAHLDAHTPSDSLSGHIHGMPIAYLLGDFQFEHDPLPITTPLKPENLMIIGTRSYETEELTRLQAHDVKIIMHGELSDMSTADLLQVCQQWLGTSPLGISFDLDVMDPQICPGVNTAEPGGLESEQLLSFWKEIMMLKPVGLEIVEYNPCHDIHHQTACFITKLLKADSGSS